MAEPLVTGATPVEPPAADPSCPAPTRCAKVSDQPLEKDEAHRSACVAPLDCARCNCWWSWRGQALGKKNRRPLPAISSGGYKNLFTYTDPSTGNLLPWVCQRPWTWGGPWAWGCFVCNAAGAPGKVADIKITRRCESDSCKQHAKCKQHRKSLRTLSRQVSEGGTAGATAGAIVPLEADCAVMEGVPRLDRWLQAAALLERFDSLGDFQRAVLTARPLNGLPDDGKDSSRKVGAQLILSLSVPLEWRDYEAIASATTSSVGLDERDGLILVHARVWVRSVGELYECLLGSFRHLGTTPEEAAEALRRVVENAFTLRVGQQGLRHEPGKGKDAQKTEHFFKARWSAFRKSVRTALADGGPSEQRGLFELSAAAPTPANRVNPFFRNLSEISRDR